MSHGKHKVIYWFDEQCSKIMDIFYFCYRIPTKTAKWLEVRPWIFRHYHIKIPDRMYTPRSHRKLAEHYARLRDDNIKPDVHSDFSRLARMIRGCSVALVHALVDAVL